MKKPALSSILVATLVLALGVIAEAQRAGKIFRIGFLDPSTAAGIAVLVDAFRQELTKLGWTEGKNITIEYRFAEQRSDRLPDLAADLVRLKVDPAGRPTIASTRRQAHGDRGKVRGGAAPAARVMRSVMANVRASDAIW
jgi:hypothetical protein